MSVKVLGPAEERQSNPVAVQDSGILFDESPFNCDLGDIGESRRVKETTKSNKTANVRRSVEIFGQTIVRLLNSPMHCLSTQEDEGRRAERERIG